MLDQTRQNIGIRLAKFHFRKQTYRQTEFTRLFSDARSALVIVPQNNEHCSMAVPILVSLQNKFRGNKLTVVIHDSFKDLSSSLAHCNVIPVRKEHINFFLMPKRSTVQTLFREKFDIVVDLNIPLVLSAAYICKGAQAGLKIGFAKQHGDEFYNFQFNASPQRSPQVRYAQLLRTLAMF
jgi:ADP-heptose:LPS heptosyltransferase